MRSAGREAAASEMLRIEMLRVRVRRKQGGGAACTDPHWNELPISVTFSGTLLTAAILMFLRPGPLVVSSLLAGPGLNS